MANDKPAQPAAPDAPAPTEPAKELDWANAGTLLEQLNGSLKGDEARPLFAKHLNALATKHGVADYHILVLFDEKDDISAWHADRIYRGAGGLDGKKDILLLIHSRGGSIEPAYLISKTCKRLAKKKFVVAVPRKAKSAATLISLGADEIHLGLMSELGPIDPQFGGLPALGMQNALNLLAELSCKHPGASDMLSKYLSQKLDLTVLGYFNRVTQSAAQYAERLLHGKPLPKEQSPQSLGDHFVNHYKDHSFVIDSDEAEKLLGPKIVRKNTPEYRFANDVYESLDFIQFVANISMNREFDYVGSLASGLNPRDVKKK